MQDELFYLNLLWRGFVGTVECWMGRVKN